MAIIKECDRCGNHYKPNRKNIITLFDTMVNQCIIIGFCGDIEFDLCSECCKEFEKFMSIKFNQNERLHSQN